MALIKCPECGKEISDEAKSCPNCGYRIRKSNVAKHKKISTYLILIGLALFVISMVWYAGAYDSELRISAGYYFGGGNSSAWKRVQMVSAFRDFMGQLGLVAFVVGIIYKIVIKVKMR